MTAMGGKRTRDKTLWIMRCGLILGVLMGSILLSSCSEEAPQACTPRRSYWNKPHNFVGLMPPRNEVALDHSGRLYWNGSPISRDRLGQYLAQSHTLNPKVRGFLAD